MVLGDEMTVSQNVLGKIEEHFIYSDKNRSELIGYLCACVDFGFMDDGDFVWIFETLDAGGRIYGVERNL